jgi:hypothetical protein
MLKKPYLKPFYVDKHSKTTTYPQLNNNLWITLCKFIMVNY